MPKFEEKVPAGGIRQAPTDDVSVNLGDGIWRPLRYTIKSFRLMKQLGIGQGEKFRNDELPELIWIGLHDASGNAPEDVTIQDLENMPPHWLPYLSKAFAAAYNLSQPKKSTSDAGQEKKEDLPTSET